MHADDQLAGLKRSGGGGGGGREGSCCCLHVLLLERPPAETLSGAPYNHSAGCWAAGEDLTFLALIISNGLRGVIDI